MNDTTNNETLKIEITQAKILDCLMHGATREDIAELRAETNTNLGELRREIKTDIARLDDKIDTKASKNDIQELKQELKSDITRLDNKMEALRKDNSKYFRWIVGLMFGSFVGIALMILKFPLLK